MNNKAILTGALGVAFLCVAISGLVQRVRMRNALADALATNTIVHGSNMITIESTNGYVSNRLVVVTNLQRVADVPSSGIRDLVNDSYEIGFKIGYAMGIRGASRLDADLALEAWRRKDTTWMNNWFATRSNAFEVIVPKP